MYVGKVEGYGADVHRYAKNGTYGRLHVQLDPFYTPNLTLLDACFLSIWRHRKTDLNEPPIQMRTRLEALVHRVTESPSLLPSVSLVVALSISAFGNSPSHSLLISSISWAFLYVYGCLQVGVFADIDNVARVKSCCTAGILFALARLCERAARDGEGLWWTMALVPLLVYVLFSIGSLSTLSSSRFPDEQVTLHRAIAKGSRPLLLVATVSALIVSGNKFVTSQAIALGLCSSLFTSAGLVVLESTVTNIREEKVNGIEGYVNANGTVLQRQSPHLADGDAYLASVRDVSGVIAIACGIGSCLFESFRTDGLVYRPRFSEVMSKDWRFGQRMWMFAQGIAMIMVSVFQNFLWVALTRSQGAIRTGFAALAAAVCTTLMIRPTLSVIWFSSLCMPAILMLYDDAASSRGSSSGPRRRIKARGLISAIATVSLLVFAANSLSRGLHNKPLSAESPLLETHPPADFFGPLSITDKKSHPIEQLVRSAERDFQAIQEKQSKSLNEAVQEYRQRYRIPPPPNFDKWYEFARRKNVELIDEYDTIHHSLLPFWALEPAAIRSRAREAIGFPDNALVALIVRDQKITLVEGGGEDKEWLRQALVGMIGNFVQYLPNMDLAFNMHDEPRVVVPNEQLSRMVDLARNDRMPRAFRNKAPQNTFSSQPADMNNGKRIDEVKTSRFNVFAHQPTWTHSRLSCPPTSPAQDFGESTKDNLTSYAYGDLGFVYNQSAFLDICMSPSLRETYGFFERPNAFNAIQELFPIFSQSKVSSFSDILYPSPWYWYDKVAYDETREVDWNEKEAKLYWRGSTTGGFSRNGGWRRQHRQGLVRKINAPGNAKIIVNMKDSGDPDWQVVDVRRDSYKELIDVKFSHVGQCDPVDCDAQNEFFELAPPADQQDAWKYKHLLDMDGNAFSGRFYAFLKSRSLVYKMAVFQEWHKDWLKPWLHFIPLSLRADEWLECVRYFNDEEAGKEKALKIAKAGRSWANKVLRKEDYEAWFFRLLLEYGRTIDDNREKIGYPGP